jgi:hypothetical protein
VTADMDRRLPLPSQQMGNVTRGLPSRSLHYTAEDDQQGNLLTNK